MKTSLTYLLLAGLLMGCSVNASTSQDVPEIYATVFRYQIGHNLSSLREGVPVACLATVTNGVSADPEQAILDKFARERILIRKQSACTVASFGVFDNASGKRGIELKLGKITWVSESEVTIEGGYFEANESGSGNIYRVRKIGDKWKVVDDQLSWIS